jgi:hypothetical protein
MRAIKLQTHVDKDHVVTLTLPDDVREGPAEVIVLVPEIDSARSLPSLGDLFSRLAEHPRQIRSKEEIDSYLEQERASWE